MTLPHGHRMCNAPLTSTYTGFHKCPQVVHRYVWIRPTMSPRCPGPMCVMTCQTSTGSILQVLIKHCCGVHTRAREFFPYFYLDLHRPTQGYYVSE